MTGKEHDALQDAVRQTRAAHLRQRILFSARRCVPVLPRSTPFPSSLGVPFSTVIDVSSRNSAALVFDETKMTEIKTKNGVDQIFTGKIRHIATFFLASDT